MADASSLSLDAEWCKGSSPLPPTIGDSMKVYGPYYRKDGRQHVIVISDGVRRTVSYPKFLMEQHLGRVLLDNETVDHIDRNFKNNDLENLRVVDKVTHGKEDAKRVKLVEFICVLCGVQASRAANQLSHNAVLGKAGPFCSKQCSGKYGAKLQRGRANKLPVQPTVPIEDREYYYNDKKL